MDRKSTLIFFSRKGFHQKGQENIYSDLILLKFEIVIQEKWALRMEIDQSAGIFVSTAITLVECYFILKYGS